MIRILNCEPENYSDAARQMMRGLGELVEQPLNRAELLAEIGAYDVLIVRLANQIDQEVIDSGTRLKAIVSATTGLDHIDVRYAESRGITVLSLRGELAFLRTIRATAEHTWALLMALLRHIPQAYQSVLAGEWQRDRFKGNELCDKTLGIVGLGRVGSMVARYGLAFGMKVIAYDPYQTEWVDGVERIEDWMQVFTRSEVLSVHVPLNESTIHLIGRDELCALPQGAVLINTARGDVIDEAALLEVLESGHLAGAAVDVIAREREQDIREDSPLLGYARTHTNLLITPHIAGATYESMRKTEVFMAQKLERFLQADF